PSRTASRARQITHRVGGRRCVTRRLANTRSPAPATAPGAASEERLTVTTPRAGRCAARERRRRPMHANPGRLVSRARPGGPGGLACMHHRREGAMGNGVEEWKEQVCARVEAQRDALISLSARIHGCPELNFEEHRAAAWLTEFLESAGLRVER